jgi:hypothetical protein
MPGQWGTYKTTLALDLSVSIMTGQTVARKYRVKRPGAVLALTLEGGGTVQSRLAAIAKERGAPANLPFAWRNDCPTLTEKGAAAVIISYVEEAAAQFRQTHGVDVVLLWVDTMITAAGFAAGEDNDAAATQKALNTLRIVSERTGTFVLALDHFGKVVEAGTRGSSNKEAAADTVLATLADREVSGDISNTRLAVRKQRDGMSGFEVGFTVRTTEVGIDEDGDPETAITVDWGDERISVKATRWSRSLRLLKTAIEETIARHGFKLQSPEGPLVDAAYASQVRAAFCDQYQVPADTPDDQKADTKKKAFHRAFVDAQARQLLRFLEQDKTGGVVWLI